MFTFILWIKDIVRKILKINLSLLIQVIKIKKTNILKHRIIQ